MSPCLRHSCGVALAILIATLPSCVLREKPAPEPPGPDVAETLTTAADTAVVPAMACPIAHTVDGRFTGWPGQTACAEWASEPLQGVYGDLYLHYEKQRLHLLNDWHLRLTDIEAGWYNLFEITTGGGAQQWEIRVFRDDTIEVLLNGEKYGQFAEGAYGFGISPRHNTPHTIFELSIVGVLPGTIEVVEKDPGPGKWETPEKALKKEPTSFSGVLQQSGGVTEAKAHHFPIITAVRPQQSPPSAPVVISGSNLGTDTGEVYIGAAAVTVTSWEDDAVTAIAPLEAGVANVFVRRSDGEDSNTLKMTVLCVQDCSGRECGPGTCGGSCGLCAANELCSAPGKCICVPQCSTASGASACGGDGCGGSCGTCAGTEVCLAGTCAPKPAECKPDCATAKCGADGCGGTCGTCSAATVCTSGQCACKPACKGKQCGGDGCGGTCGGCGSSQVCGGGQCVCKPECGPKLCGNDGCGGVCGVCPSGNSCVAYACCKPECSGKSCGWDGCSGTCGDCGAGTYCLSGKCVCEPQCNGKVCGPDGCGGLCGSCAFGTCQANGSCKCVKSCKDKSCGGDGCGGSCGTCDAGDQCVQGVCQ